LEIIATEYREQVGVNRFWGRFCRPEVYGRQMDLKKEKLFGWNDNGSM